MGSNEVIIDGCNVAECEWMIDGKDVIGCNSYICCCEEINNCYFKQLQRAKAENEKLKEKYNAALKNNANITELQLEKKDYIEFKQYYKTENERLQAENEKLKKALEEIKDMAERFKYSDRTEEEKLLCFKNDMLDILYRIDEVLK